MPVYHSSVLDNDAETNKYFSTPIGTLGSPAVLPRETFDGVECLAIHLGNETPDVTFTGNGGAEAHDDMLAAVGAHADGEIAFCYDVAKNKHGRYERQSGAWVRTGPIKPIYEYDDNHQSVLLDYLLLCQTCFDTGHPAIASDGPTNPFVDKVAFPNAGDLTNHYMQVEMRMVDFSVRIADRMGWHLQGELTTAPRYGTGNGGLGGFPMVNAMNNTDILGIAGTGSNGIYGDNPAQYLGDTGWFTFKIPFSPSDADWTMMLGNTDKDGHEGAVFAENNRYIGTSAATLVGPDLHKVNAYLGLFRWNPTPGIRGSNTPRPRVDEPAGSIYIKRIDFGTE